MKKKIFVACCFILLVITTFPLVSGNKIELNDNNNDLNLSKWEFYNSCYIEAEGEIAYNIDWIAFVKMPNMWKTFWFRPFNDDKAIVSYWMLVFKFDSKIKIYSEENGELLWDHHGSDYPQLKIFGFYGNYIPTTNDNDAFQVSLKGNALMILTKLRS
jgi:hypothetical protein